VFKGISLIISFILFILYSFTIFYVIEIKRPQLQKENPFYYLFLLTAAVVLLIFGIMCLHEFILLMKKSIVFCGSIPNTPSNNNNSNNGSNRSSPSPGNNNSGNLIGESSSSRRKRKNSEDSDSSTTRRRRKNLKDSNSPYSESLNSSDSESENFKGERRQGFASSIIGFLEFKAHCASLHVTKYSNAVLSMEKLLENINKNSTQVVGIVKHQGDGGSQDRIINVAGGGKFLIRNGMTISNDNINKIQSIIFNAEKHYKKSEINCATGMSALQDALPIDNWAIEGELRDANNALKEYKRQWDELTN
jgi:hypothetical protein